MAGKLRKVVHHGQVRWLLDLRSLGIGRKYFETEDAAKTFRAKKLEEAKQHGLSALTLTHAQRVKFMVVEEKLSAVGADIVQAAEFFLRFHKAKQTRTLKEAFEEFLTSKRASGKRPRYLRALDYSIGRLIKPIEERDCGAVTRSDLEKWLFSSGLELRTVRGRQI